MYLYSSFIGSFLDMVLRCIIGGWVGVFVAFMIVAPIVCIRQYRRLNRKQREK